MNINYKVSFQPFASLHRTGDNSTTGKHSESIEAVINLMNARTNTSTQQTISITEHSCFKLIDQNSKTSKLE